jgi:beta-aspartyl-peptidase (threonine type)
MGRTGRLGLNLTSLRSGVCGTEAEDQVVRRDFPSPPATGTLPEIPDFAEGTWTWEAIMVRGWILAMALTGVWLHNLHAEDVVVENVVLGIHGGIGLDKAEMTPEIDQAVRTELERALRAGFEALNKPNGTGLDAVEAAIRLMEDSPQFNAGKGAVFTHDGRNELDASIMEGKTLRAGAVAGVTTIKHPISAARAVMEKSKHVLLISRGAEAFAAEAGLEIVDPSYFKTDARWQQLQKQLEAEKKRSDARGQGAVPRSPAEREPRIPERNLPGFSFGTVGAVALDKAGHLSAGTSTGGMSNKRWGRVGDSPIIGAGTYADNEACAISATGHGEYFIRYAVAHDIVALMKYSKLPVHEAADTVIRKKLKSAGGEGGVICLDPQGRFYPSYNSEGMYRGCITRDGQIMIKIYEQ